MYTMKEACAKTGLRYETLKFYCNQGLVPNVKRDSQNRRIFNDRDIAWINSLNCLKNCNMGIAEMEAERKRIEDAMAYIDWKQGFYDDVLSGKTKYFINLIASDE